MFLEPNRNYTRDLDIDDKPKGNKSWVYWTIVTVTLIVAFAIGIFIYELICRMKDKMKSQIIFDGGPPATPTHSFSYTVGVRAERASPSFDPQLSVLKIELLDRFNRYVTSVAVPCFLFKLRVDEAASIPSEKSGQSTTHPMYVKTMTILQEQWASTDQNQLIAFQLVRRRPLTDVASARILHDCYAKDAYITFNYIVFHDHLADVVFRINLKDQPIRAVHPCPPTATQVFPVEKLTTPTDDLKSFINFINPGHSWCPSCWRGQ